MKKTYQGSCHCKAVRFEADIDLAQGTGKCNCSICWKLRNWSVLVKPHELRVHAGEDALGKYQFNTKTNEHNFCKHCGIRVFGHGYVEEIGGAYASIALAALDDLDPSELLAAPITYFDGRNNAWQERPAEVRHL
jgi:hypothetical protein